MQAVWSNASDYECKRCGQETQYGKNLNLLFCKNCGMVYSSKNEDLTTLDYYDDAKQCKYYLPFRIKVNEVEIEFNKWLSEGKLMPRGFKEKVKLRNIRRVFVPHILISGLCNIDVKGNTQQTLESALNFVRYSSRGFEHSAQVNLYNVPLILNNQVDRGLVEAAEPFYVADKMEFANNNDFNDVAVLEINRHIVNQDDHYGVRISKGMEDYCKKHYHSNKEESISISENGSYCEDLSFNSCYLPIYQAEYEFDGEIYQVVVNGQTGRIACDLPSCFEEEEKIRNNRRILYIILTIVLPIVVAVVVKISFGFLLLAFFALAVSFFVMRALCAGLLAYYPEGTHYPSPMSVDYYTDYESAIWKGTTKNALPISYKSKDSILDGIRERYLFAFFALRNRK